MKISRMYTNEKGEPCFDDVEIAFTKELPLGKLSNTFSAHSYFYFETTVEYNAELKKLHNPSMPLLLAHLSGKVKIYAGDGSFRIFGPGDIYSSMCLMEATSGKGHGSEVIEGPVSVLTIGLAQGELAVSTKK